MPTEPLRSVDRRPLPTGTSLFPPTPTAAHITAQATQARSSRSLPSWQHALLAASLALTLAACGGSGDESGNSGQIGLNSTDTTGLRAHDRTKAGPSQAGRPGAQTSSSSSQAAAAASGYRRWTLSTPAEASRFLAQASYGSNPKDIKALTGRTANEWIEAQFLRPPFSLLNAMRYWRQRRGPEGNKNVTELQDAHNAWWVSTIQQDQLRQRVAFALSQIFVVSSAGVVGEYPKGLVSYYDTLVRGAFGNFRQLLQDVTLHPMMGTYLTYIGNRKERFDSTGKPTQAPDENYAREVMQLFTIGLEQLNLDGTPKKDAGDRPIPTYSNDDVIGLARVFTGLSWNGGQLTHECFVRAGNCAANTNERETRPMVAYDQYHSTLEKRFLGTTIPEGQSSTMADLNMALNTLFNHPNVGPFIGKQLIQRLVTSNPSEHYVRRVASAFNNNGQGVRGDMKAVIRAVLLDEEARGAHARKQPDFGRIREPVLRFTHLMRAFEASSRSGYWTIGPTNAPSELNQTAMRAPSVFNFYRPGYTPAGTPIANANRVAPEMQILNESSVAGYADYLNRFVGATSIHIVGLGKMIPHPEGEPATNGMAREVRFNLQPLIAKANDVDQLLDEIDVLLLNGQMQSETRKIIRAAVSEVVPKPPKYDMRQMYRERVSLALYLALLSPDYLVLK